MNKLIFTAFILSNVVFSQTPYISATSMSADNTSIIVTFSEAVYNSTGGSGALEALTIIELQQEEIQVKY